MSATDPGKVAESTTAQKVADRNYPTDYEWDVLMGHQEDDYDLKMVSNLRAMLFLARDEICSLVQERDSLARAVEAVDLWVWANPNLPVPSNIREKVHSALDTHTEDKT